MDEICVLGLGYIGLPTASVLAIHGFKVIGVDVNEKVITKVKNGEPHIKEPGLRTMVEAAIGSGNLLPRLEPEEADAFIIAVPTPVTNKKTADMSFVESAASSIAPLLRAGNLVVLESTSPPGTTEELLVPMLASSGLKIGEELYVAHCPERVLPGRILKELVENDRIIGGINPKSAEKARELYSAFVEGKIYLTDVTTAEMVKLIENTYRDVNIALANELAIICEKLGISAWEVIELANKHPRVNLHKPGPGVGGHCLPVDPWFIVERFPDKARLIRTSREINDQQPKHVFELIKEVTKGIKEPKVTILGVAYKGNIDDTRESPAVTLVRLLQEAGYKIGVYDPHVEQFEVQPSSLEEAFKGSDCAVVLAEHDEFSYFDPQKCGILMRTSYIIDTKELLDLAKWEKVGFHTRLLGSGRAND